MATTSSLRARQQYGKMLQQTGTEDPGSLPISYDPRGIMSKLSDTSQQMLAEHQKRVLLHQQMLLGEMKYGAETAKSKEAMIAKLYGERLRSGLSNEDAWDGAVSAVKQGVVSDDTGPTTYQTTADVKRQTQATNVFKAGGMFQSADGQTYVVPATGDRKSTLVTATEDQKKASTSNLNASAAYRTKLTDKWEYPAGNNPTAITVANINAGKAINTNAALRNTATGANAWKYLGEGFAVEIPKVSWSKIDYSGGAETRTNVGSALADNLNKEGQKFYHEVTLPYLEANYQTLPELQAAYTDVQTRIANERNDDVLKVGRATLSTLSRVYNDIGARDYGTNAPPLVTGFTYSTPGAGGAKPDSSGTGGGQGVNPLLR